MNSNLEQIQDRYLGQTAHEFTANGGNPARYAALVFSGYIFGPGVDPRSPDLGIDTEEDLRDALEYLTEREAGNER